MKRILCYGDSNTWGYDARTCMRLLEHERWDSILQDKLGSDYRVYEEGYNGRTTVYDDPLDYGRNGIEFIEVAMKTHDPIDVLVIMLGTNDLKDMFGVSALLMADGMRRFVTKCQDLISHSLVPECKILLINPAHPTAAADGTYWYGMSENSVPKAAEFGIRLKALAEELGCDFLDADSLVKVSPVDGLHLPPESHKVLADAVYNKIKEMIG